MPLPKVEIWDKLQGNPLKLMDTLMMSDRRQQGNINLKLDVRPDECNGCI